ncbi:MAG: serine hydrolase domain-containing protein [Bacteroidales bacterium]
MSGKLTPERINPWVEKIVNNKNIFSAIFHVENEDRSFVHTAAAGDINPDSKYFIASTTKLYVTAVLLRLMEENKISLDDKLGKHLPDEMVQGLHIHKGTDHSRELKVLHLLSNTSGIPDYFFHKQSDGKTAADDLIAGNDQPWHLEKTLEVVKTMKPNFKPGAKAAYSDTNYQLLGRIIENITGKPIADVFREFIFEPLNLKNTYSYLDPNDTSPARFYYGNQQTWLPKYMTSVTVEGGIVSTAEESARVLRAFFNGELFPKDRIETLKKWRMLFSPGVFYFGIGLEKIWTPWIASPFKPLGETLGFWGQTSAFAFYNTKTGLYMTGTANQFNSKGHQALGNVVIKSIKAAL